jgi:transporter family protein
MQYLGFAVMVISYYWFSTVGKKEGIIFYSNKWILCILLAAMLGATSGIYDKYLLQTLNYNPLVLQVWFSIYIVPVLGIAVGVFWLPNRKKHTPFVWRWSIPVIAALLIVADVLYFRALSNPQALVSMLSIIRASCIVVSFVAGGLIFRELRLSLKAIALVGVIAGICLILHST